MPRAEILLFGAPRIERDNVPIEFDTRKALALLAYVVVTGSPQRRDTLAALLWPEGDQAHARAALRRTLSTLNSGLGGEAVAASRELIAPPDGANFFVDVVEFRRLITPAAHQHASDLLSPECRSRHQRAVDLYREDFLDGFSLRDSPEFEVWQRTEAEALRRELAGALERLSTAEAATGDFAAAIVHARRWLSLDRLNEPAHRQLMRLYAWSGERAASRRQYQECVAILDGELNVSPLEATVDLYQTISQDRLEPPASGRNVVTASKLAEAVSTTHDAGSNHPTRPAFPLVGRAVEKDRLFATFDTIGRDGRFVAIQGEAGIGKTRLTDELVAHARSRGAAIITSRCYDGELELAYGPFVEGLRAAMTQPEWLTRVPTAALAEAARLIPEISNLNPGLPAPTPLDGPGALSRFFDGLSQVLRAFHNDGVPSLIVIDDVHRADEASLGLLTYLARRLAGWPVCLVVSWRTEDVSPEHRLSHLLAEVEREGFGERVVVGRLSRTDVIKLARLSPKGAKLSNQMVDQLYHDSEGVPFFVVEYLNAVDGSDASPPGGLPRGVRDLLMARLAAIDETGRQLLGTAAIIGRSFDFDTLREASGRGEEETVDGLDALVGHGMIREIQSPDDHRLAYDFSHEKLRTVVAEEMSLARRRLLHRRVAAALEAHVRRPSELGPLASQIAFHLQQGDAGGESARFYRLAGEHDRSLYANVSALAHFRSALVLGDSEAGMIHEQIGDIEVLLGDYGAALASYEHVHFEKPADVARLQHKLGMLHNRRGDWDAAEVAFEAALTLSDSPQGTDARALLLADWSLTSHLRGDESRALELGAQALAEAEASGSARSLAQAHNLLGVLARAGGDLDEALDQLEQSLRFARTLDDPGATTAALNNLALVRADREELDEAIALAEAALERCRAQGDRHREAALHNNLADFHHRAGRTELAMLHLKQAVAIFAEIGDDGESPQPEIWKLVEW